LSISSINRMEANLRELSEKGNGNGGLRERAPEFRSLRLF
jgi:hypothetical protein